jgi:hypothetical protein
MFRYATSYRFYTLAKLGFGLAYVWYIRDFYWIHAGMGKLLPLLLFNPSDIVFSGNPVLDVYLRRLAVFVSGKTVVCALIFSSPLLQRLVVPFGFCFSRYRLWSVLILGTMHIGYAILMRVNLFPLVGIASLLMILPYRNALVPHLSARLPHQPKKIVPQKSQLTLIQNAVICLLSFWLVLEAARVTNFNATPWENKLMIVPAWRMFPDGGVTAGGKWRIFLDTPQGTVDASALSQEALPHLWRDRFYSDIIFHELLGNDKAPTARHLTVTNVHLICSFVHCFPSSSNLFCQHQA